MNFADTHQRRNDYLAAQQLPLVPGGEVAGRARGHGRARRRALRAPAGTPRYAVAPQALTFPIPDGVDDGTALALVIQGLTAWHLYRTSARVQPGESVVVHAAAGGVGSLAVQLGHADGRRARDRDRLDAGQARARARARRRRGDRRRSRGPERPPRRGQRRPPGRRRLRDGRRRGLRRVARARSRRSAGSSPTASPRARATRSTRASSWAARARSSASGSCTAWAGRRWSTRRWPISSRAPRAGSCARSSAPPTRWPRRARAQIDLAERRTTGKVLLDPHGLMARVRHDLERRYAQRVTTFADLGLSESSLARAAGRRLRAAEPDPGAGDPRRCSRVATSSARPRRARARPPRSACR